MRAWYSSVTAYNTYCGDIHGTSKKVFTRGYRKCHFVKRHHLKTNAPHKGPGRQPGSECVPGKNTGVVLRNLSLRYRVLPFIPNRYKLSITRKCKEEYPREIILDFDHNHSINSADALYDTNLSQKIAKLNFLNYFQRIIHLPLP